MLTRRTVLKGIAALGVGMTLTGGYALAEPWRLAVTRHRVTPPGWPDGLHLKLAVIADLHVCEPWMGLDRVRQIVARTNALKPDAVLLLGDYVVGYRMLKIARDVPEQAWADILARLEAPFGIHAVQGNHDWWESAVQKARSGPTRVQLALERAGIKVYENDAVRLEKKGRPFWIAGLGDQWAFYPKDGRRAFGRIAYEGVDDLPGTLAKVGDDAPVILMAHEPDIFPEVPARVAVTISGHTHGGQVRLAGFSPIIPSKFGRRFSYGHIVEQGRHLVVSGGLGCSGVPVRFGVPPEIVMVELGGSGGERVGQA